jgi:hypothetical protein
MIVGVEKFNLFCIWVRSLDEHFNISCVNKTKQRGNKQFKSITGASQWNFKYCPYCGREIKINK